MSNQVSGYWGVCLLFAVICAGCTGTVVDASEGNPSDATSAEIWLWGSQWRKHHQLAPVVVDAGDTTTTDAGMTETPTMTADAGTTPVDTGSTGDAGTGNTGGSGSTGGSTGGSDGTWTWPPTASNTGPDVSTLVDWTGPINLGHEYDGKTITNMRVRLQNGQAFRINAHNLTLRNCWIEYVGTEHSPDGTVIIGGGESIHNVTFDHCEINGRHRHEYGLRVYGSFTVQYSRIHDASHPIDAFGDTDPNYDSVVYRNYIYGADDNPYGGHGGHSNVVYFQGSNRTTRVEDNTLIMPRYVPDPTKCPDGTTPCYEQIGTSAVTVYADEGSVADRTYIITHNVISGSAYFPVRFYGGSSGIQSVTHTNNVYTAADGWPKSSVDGDLYVFQNVATYQVTGNTWGSDTPWPGQSANANGMR